VWARPGQDATQEWPPGHGTTQEWPPGAPEATEWGPRPGWSAPEGWGQQAEPGAPRGRRQGWETPAPPRRGPGRTPLVVGAGIALLLVVAAVAVLGPRGSGGQPTASPGTSALAPGAGGGGAGSGGGGEGGGGNGATGAGSLRLPDRVGGMARIPLDESSLLQGQQGLLDMITRSGGLDGWGLGAYGPGRDDPRFVLLVVRTSQAGAADLIAGGMVDAVRQGLGGADSSPRAFTRSGVRYDCWNGSLGGLCSFQDGPTVGLGFARDADLGRLSQLTDDGRRGVRGS
jgi:hypothetical protein